MRRVRCAAAASAAVGAVVPAAFVGGVLGFLARGRDAVRAWILRRVLRGACWNARTAAAAAAAALMGVVVGRLGGGWRWGRRGPKEYVCVFVCIGAAMACCCCCNNNGNGGKIRRQEGRRERVEKAPLCVELLLLC